MSQTIDHMKMLIIYQGGNSKISGIGNLIIIEIRLKKS